MKMCSTKELSMVVKANAYGHGAKDIVKIANDYVDYFQVEDFLEYEEIKQLTDRKILVAGYLSNNELAEISKNNDIPTLISLEQLKSVKYDLNFHLKLDCLVGRQGILLNQLPETVLLIKKRQNLKLMGVYTHFTDVENKKHTYHQLKLFSKSVRFLRESIGNDFKIHINSSSGAFLNEDRLIKTDINRVGIAAYGHWRSNSIFNKYHKKIDLKPVLSWRSVVTQVKTLPAGYPIGYSQTYISKNKTRIAVVPQGYADGIDRKNSNRGFVLIKGVRCKILGTVSMNMIVVDVSNVMNCKSGDIVTIVGHDNGAEINVNEIAQITNTINYEVLSRISPNLPRKIV